jgi:hypothetical protein
MQGVIGRTDRMDSKNIEHGREESKMKNVWRKEVSQ